MSKEIEITPRVEELVWKNLGVKSARQIATETGLKPDQVLAIKQRLLDEVDVLTVQQKRQKLIIDLQDIAKRTQEDYDNAPYEFKSGLMNSSVAAMKTVLVELNRADKGEQQQINKLNDLRVRELVTLIREVVDISVEEVSQAYDLDRDELFAIFNTNLEKAARMRDAVSQAGHQ